MGMYGRIVGSGMNLFSGLFSGKGVRKAGSRAVESVVTSVGGNKRGLKTGVAMAQLSGGRNIPKSVAKRVAKSTNVNPIINRRVVGAGLVGAGGLGLAYGGVKVFDSLKNVSSKTSMQRQIDQRNISDSDYLDNLDRQREIFNDQMIGSGNVPFDSSDVGYLDNPAVAVSEELEKDAGVIGGISPLAVGGLLALAVGGFLLFKKKKKKK